MRLVPKIELNARPWAIESSRHRPGGRCVGSPLGEGPTRGSCADMVNEPFKNRSRPHFGTPPPGPQLTALDKGTAAQSNNGWPNATISAAYMQRRTNPISGNKLTRSENLRVEELVAELNVEFEFLRERLRQQVAEVDVDTAEHTAVLMATTMSQIAIKQGAQRGDPTVISSMRQMGAFPARCRQR